MRIGAVTFQGLLSVCSKSAKMSLQCHRAEVYDGSKEAQSTLFCALH